MKWRNVLVLAAIAALGLAMLPTSAVSQQKTLREQLIGTWTFVSDAQNHWGPNPKGQFILEANGRYSFMISRSDIPKFAGSNVTQGTAEENKAVVTGMIAHFGTWSVDEGTKTITTNVEAASFPNLNGNNQKRVIVSLTADELKFSNAASASGTSDVAVWKRAK